MNLPPLSQPSIPLAERAGREQMPLDASSRCASPAVRALLRYVRVTARTRILRVPSGPVHMPISADHMGLQRLENRSPGFQNRRATYLRSGEPVEQLTGTRRQEAFRRCIRETRGNPLQL